MRPLSVRLLRNIRNPLQFIDWTRYQFSRGNDVYLSTLPSSGTHWLRFLIAKGIVDAYDLDYAFTDIRPESVVPTFRDKTARFAFNDHTDIPRVQHTHKPYSVLLRGGRVIVLVRDLRDTMVSSYDTYSEHKNGSITFSEFLRADGVDEKRHRTLEWRIDFLNQWHRNWDNVDDHLCVKYEVLKRDTHGVTQDVLEFIGLDNVSDALVSRVTEFCDIDHMRYIEEHGEANPDILGDPNEQVKPAGEGAKINEGTIHRYRDYFDESDKRYFKRLVDERLEDYFGYDYGNF
ncbi:sulfotransferase domain-containing protein [Halorubrum trueperi]|uniref:Sulfotransferase domain-containing protein n=1 Tax=Halorubrum trueperi TaxID=2004704 RepID=A0ABD5UFJ2_9EURY